MSASVSPPADTASMVSSTWSVSGGIGFPESGTETDEEPQRHPGRPFAPVDQWVVPGGAAHQHGGLVVEVGLELVVSEGGSAASCGLAWSGVVWGANWERTPDPGRRSATGTVGPLSDRGHGECVDSHSPSQLRHSSTSSIVETP